MNDDAKKGLVGKEYFVSSKDTGLTFLPPLVAELIMQPTKAEAAKSLGYEARKTPEYPTFDE